MRGIRIMIYVDVHAHLNHRVFAKDIDRVIENARQAGVKKIITNGVNPATNRECIELSKKYDIVECALGAYPIDALNIETPGEGLSRSKDFNLDEEIEFWKKNASAFVAVGEVGLDYHYAKEHAAQQKVNFQKIIACAEKIKKPIIVHTRKAERDCVDMLMSSKIPPHQIILHSFGGKKSIIKDAADHGMMFSIPPIIKRLNHFQSLVSRVNINQLFTETDCPYLGPEKEERNEPANVTISVQEIAKIKNFEPIEVANTIFMNYQRTFE
jgi:TatD DNase family protein